MFAYQHVLGEANALLLAWDFPFLWYDRSMLLSFRLHLYLHVFVLPRHVNLSDHVHVGRVSYIVSRLHTPYSKRIYVCKQLRNICHSPPGGLFILTIVEVPLCIGSTGIMDCIIAQMERTLQKRVHLYGYSTRALMAWCSGGGANLVLLELVLSSFVLYLMDVVGDA